MKTYTAPEAEVIRFDVKDIITASSGGGADSGENLVVDDSMSILPKVGEDDSRSGC